MLHSLRPTKVDLKLPRFKVQFGVKDLRPALESLGVHQAFEGMGQFSEMSDDEQVHLSSVLHKVVVEVNEAGSEAAAVTAGIMNTRAVLMPRPVKEVVVDRPFIFAI